MRVSALESPVMIREIKKRSSYRIPSRLTCASDTYSSFHRDLRDSPRNRFTCQVKLEEGRDGPRLEAGRAPGSLKLRLLKMANDEVGLAERLEGRRWIIFCSTKQDIRDECQAGKKYAYSSVR